MRTPLSGRSRRYAAAVGVATAVLALAGCGSFTPNAASVVNGHAITHSEVDELAQAQCAGVELAKKQGQQQAVARKQLTERALGLLIDIRLNLDYGRSLGLSARPDETTQAFAQVQPLIAALPAQYQSYLDDVFHQWAQGRDMMVQVGEAATGQAASATNGDQLLNAGYAKRETWLQKDATIDTDPRYSPGKVGWPGEGDGSVSKPVSSFAKDAGKSTPSSAFLGNLPASMVCG